MSKLTLNDLTSLVNPTTAIGTINDNNERIETALENTLSRDGTAPNNMNADLDMNSYRIVNLPEPINPTEPLRKGDADTVLALADDFAEAIAQVAQDVIDSAANAASAAASAQTVEDALASIGALTVDSVASRAAGTNTTFDPTVLFVRTAGYYTIGDGGGALYKRVTSEPSHIGKFRSVDRYLPDGSVSAGNGGWWQYVTENVVNIKQFGAKGDLSQDDKPAIQGAITYAEGSPVFAPKGQYRVDSEITSDKPVNLSGVGTGAGPGSAAQSNSYVTQFMLNYENPSFITVTSNFPSIFKDFQINVNPGFRTPGRGGWGIAIYGPAGAGNGTCSNSLIQNVSFQQVAQGIRFFKPNWHTVTNCYFGDWVTDAIYSETEVGIEGSTGHITNNFFFGAPTLDQRSCIYLRNGYTVIQENEILGSQVGVRIGIDRFNAGYIRILDNTIEEQGYYGVYVENPLSSTTMAFLQISRNEFFQLFTQATYIASVAISESLAVYLESVDISNNDSRSLASNGFNHFYIGAGRSMTISNNRIVNLSGNSHVGISITGSSTNNGFDRPILVNGNTIQGTFSARYNFPSSNVVLLVDPFPMTFDQIPLYCVEGSQIFVSDGRSTNNSTLNYTLISGGGGTPAFFRGGIWLGLIQ